MAHKTKRRVVITGLGAITANGIGKDAFWEAISKGISGIKPIQRFSAGNLPLQVAGEINNFLANDYIERKLVNRTDRMTHFVFATIQEALQDAGIALAQENPQRVGAVIANTFGGLEYVIEQIQTIYARGPRFVSAYTAIAWLQVANIGQASIRYGIQGYCKTPLNDTAGGLDGLGIAYQAIAPCVKGDDPNSYRPFDRRAAGLILAEGAGMCILEDYEHARQRGASIYGEIVGYGQTNDANGFTPPSSSGKQYARSMCLAMQEAGLRTQDIGYFSLDGQAMLPSDAGEADALHRAFSTDVEDLPVSVPRTMIGHSYAAAGVLDTITALQALQHRAIPPTINCEELEPGYGLNLVRDETRPLSQPAVLIGGRGAGGINVVLAVKKV